MYAANTSTDSVDVFPVALELATKPAGEATATAGTLNGEVFGSVGSNDSGCTGSSSLNYFFLGTATGPYAGTFDEFGDVTFSGGTITSWHANFTIMSGANVVQGTIDLAPGGTGTATCASAAGGTASSTSLIYTTSSPFIETGPTQTTLSFTFGGVGGSFAEHFGSVQQAGCDTSGQGNGDDQCNQ